MKKVVFLSFFLIVFASAVNLTQDEKKFISSHTITCISTMNWEPFNLSIGSELDGIAIDYWRYVKKELNLKTKCIVSKTWTNVLKNIKQKKADITLSTTITPDRKKYAIFTKSYASFPVSIATRNDIGYIADIDFLENKTIAVGKNYTVAKLLKTYYPHFHIKEVTNIDEALKLVSSGKVFAAIDIEPVLAYKINKYKYANLKIAGKTPLNFDIRFMVRDDYKDLVTAINKVITHIPKGVKDNIYRKWIAVRVQEGFSKNYIYKIYFFGAVIFILLVLWGLLLRKEIQKRRDLEKELLKLATIDQLTSIFNRYKIDAVIQEQIKIAQRYHRPLSFIFFDIDHFKNINDTYGHKEGDKVLKKISKVILQNIRDTDIFGRWGGEEFLIILPETDLQNSVQLANKLKNIIQNYSFSNLYDITCSFGVSQFQENDDIDAIMHKVDTLLYQAKQNGRNQVAFK
jgi:polar amino acid transport system substrate-binding protein